MARVAVIGERTRVTGYALGGAVVLVAESDDEMRAAWNGLPTDVAVVVLTKRAADAVGHDRASGRRPLSVVLPS
jgi:vacuolar-type H+-ATPase subunit F/Vma7